MRCVLDAFDSQLMATVMPEAPADKSLGVVLTVLQLGLIAVLGFRLATRCRTWMLVQRAVTSSRRGDYETAMANWNKAAGISPRDAGIYANRGLVYLKKGTYDKAIADFNEAIRLDPKGHCGVAYNNLAWMLATCPQESFRNGKRAVAYATTACKLRGWKKWNFLGTLAAAYAEAGQFDRAIAWQERALQSLDCPMDGYEYEQGRHQLALYKRDQPYHEKAPIP